MLEIGVLGGVVLLLAVGSFLVRRKEREPARSTMADPTSRFPHAVASFEPTSTGVLLWTRLAGAATEASWAIARDPAMRDVVARGTATTSPDADHTVVSTSTASRPPPPTGTGSRPAASARRSVGPGRSPATAPTASASPPCAARDYSVAPLGVYRALAEREVDLVLHLGDYIYEDDGSRGGRRHDPPHVATTLDDYRRRIAQIRADPDAQALHLRHPMVTIWDDHDLADNAWRDGAKDARPRRARRLARPGRGRRAGRAGVAARLACRRRHDPLTTWRSVRRRRPRRAAAARHPPRGARPPGRRRRVAGPRRPERSLLGAEQRALAGRAARRRHADRGRWSPAASW